MKYFTKYFKTVVSSLLIASLVQVTMVQAQEPISTLTTEGITTQTTATATNTNSDNASDQTIIGEPLEFTVSGRVLDIGDKVKVVYKPLQNSLKDVSICFPKELSLSDNIYTESPNKVVVEQKPVDETVAPPESTGTTTPIVPVAPTTPDPIVEPTTAEPTTIPSDGTEVITAEPDLVPLGEPDVYGGIIENKIVIDNEKNEVGSMFEIEFVADSIAHGDFIITGTMANGEIISKTVPLEAYLPDEIDLKTSDPDVLKTTIETTKKSELTIVLTDDVTLKEVITVNFGGTLNKLTFIPTNKNNVTIYGAPTFRTYANATIKYNNKAPFTFNFNGITIDGSKLTSTNGTITGIEFANGSDLIVENLVMKNVGLGITNSFASMKLKNVTITDVNSSNAVAVNTGNLTADNLTIDNVYGTHAYSYGIHMINKADALLTLTNSTITGAKTGIVIYNNADISNSKISNNRVKGISLNENMGTKVSSFKLDNSFVEDNGDAGIYAFAANMEIKNSTISGNKAHGFISKGDTLDITDSKVFDNMQRGLYITVPKATIINSNISTNKSGGIYFEGTQINITGGELSSNDFTYDMGYTNKVTSGGGLYTKMGLVNLDGVNIYNNKATYINNPIDSGGLGGGIFSNDINIINSTFKSNTAKYGAGIYARGKAIIKSTTFQDNNAEISAGGLNVAKGLKIEDSKVISNQANQGGGINVSAAGEKIEIINTEITNNTARYAVGGGIYVENNTSELILTNGKISENRSFSEGGGIYTLSKSTVNGTELIKNSSLNLSGGAIYSTNSINVNGATFNQNTSAKDGGGAIMASGTVTVVDGIFTENKANNPVTPENGHGGAIRAGAVNVSGTSKFENNYSRFSGGAIYTVNATIDGANVLFNGNTADYSGGAICGATGTTGTLIIKNGVTISNNKAKVWGGGVAFNNVVADNINVLGNSCASNGGGIGATTLTLSNSLIKGNIASGSGGGINTTSANISTSQIIDNKAYFSGQDQIGGGGVKLNSGNISSTNIINNWAKTDGGGIYIHGNNLGKVTIDSDVVFDKNVSEFGYSYWTINENASAGDSLTHINNVKTTKFSTVKPDGVENAIQFTNGYNNYDISYMWAKGKYTTTVNYTNKDTGKVIKTFKIMSTPESFYDITKNPTKLDISLTGQLSGFEFGNETWKPIVDEITPAVTIEDNEVFVSTTVKNQIITIPCEVEKLYKVSFDPRNGEALEDKFVEENKPVKKPTNPFRTDGAIFAGWYLKSSANNNPWDFDTTIDDRNDGIVLEARYNYKVEFNSDGGNITPKEQVLFEGDKIVKPLISPTKSGYVFVDWYKGDETFSFADGITSNISLKAVYNKLNVPTANDDVFTVIYIIGTTVLENKITDRVRATGTSLNGYELISDVTKGTLNFDKTTGEFEYILTEAPTEIGVTVEDSFTFKANDANGLSSNNATVDLRFEVIGVLDPIKPVEPIEPAKPVTPVETPVTPLETPTTPIETPTTTIETPVTPVADETQTIEQQIIPQGSPFPITQNGVNFIVQPIQPRNVVGDDEFLVSNEEGTPLGIVSVQKPKTIEDIDIQEELVPLGIGVKENPKTGDTNINYTLFISTSILSLIVLVYLQKKADNRN